MKRRIRLSLHGFTIIEVLIVIAIMGFLLAMAILLVSGDTAKADFTVAINGFKQQMEQIINETSNGYYHDQTNNFKCNGINFTPVNITYPATNDQAQNDGCILLGRIVQFAPNGNPHQLAIYPIAGDQFGTGGYQGQNTTTISGTNPADPELVYKNVDSQVLAYGLTVTAVCLAAQPTPCTNNNLNTTAVAFLVGDPSGNIASYTGCTGLCSGAVPLSLYYDSYTAHQISNIVSATDLACDVGNYIANPTCLNTKLSSVSLVSASGVDICVSGGSKSGLVQIGGTGNLSVELTIHNGSTCQ